MSVCWLQFIKGYTVVQDGFDAGLFRNKLKASQFISQNVSFLQWLYHLRFEGNFTHRVIEAPNFEFTDLKTIIIIEIPPEFRDAQFIQSNIVMPLQYLDIHGKSIEPHGTNECYSSGQGIHHVQVGVYPYS